MILRTRFAPSPTGPLHLGHAYSACLAHDMARAFGGHFQLRIEDIDRTRARRSWEDALIEDLQWLGLSWDAPPLRQSDRTPRYRAVLEQLWHMGLLYVCQCKRRDILAAVEAPQEGAAPQFGPDGLVYPGTCRLRARDRRGPLPLGEALRLDMRAALERIGQERLSYIETGTTARRISVRSEDILDQVGDIVLSRRDFPGSYHLSVVLDDADQGITHVVRGEDLQAATIIHVVLQSLLKLPKPKYHHHRLIRDDAGKRLAKRDDARALRLYREAGETPENIRARIGLQAGAAELMGAISSVSSLPTTDV